MSETFDYIDLISWDDEDDDLADEPAVWIDHTGKAWRLSKMESTHLVNILRLIVNRWAESLGVRPVPIKNPQAIFDPDMPDSEVAWLAKQIANDNQTELALKKEADTAEDRAYKAERERDDACAALEGLLEYAEQRGEMAGDLPSYDRRVRDARRVLGKEGERFEEGDLR